jgi:uncharacterized protein YceK
MKLKSRIRNSILLLLLVGLLSGCATTTYQYRVEKYGRTMEDLQKWQDRINDMGTGYRYHGYYNDMPSAVTIKK